MPLVPLLAVVLAAACAGSGGPPAGDAPGAPGPGAPAADPAPPAAPAPPAPSAPQGGQIRIPTEVAGFRLTGRRDFEQPGAGSVFRSTGTDSLFADVYLYPGPGLDARCDVDCAARVLAQEAEGFETIELPALVEDGTILSFELLAHDTLAAPADAAWRVGRQVRVDLVYPDERGLRRSEWVVRYLPFARVKVRATYRETPERTERVAAFVRELIPALVSPAP
jgi:hypothetical protein